MTAPLISPLPTPPSRSDAPQEFADRADAFLGALPGFRAEANAQAQYTDDRVTAALNAGLENAAANAAAAGLARDQSQAGALSSVNGAASANSSKEVAATAAASAAASLAATLSAAGLSGARAFPTYALAVANVGSLTSNQVVLVTADETMGGQGAFYRFNGTSLVFLRLQEFYQSPSPAVASDSVQNVLTKLLVSAGFIPAAAPSMSLEY